MRSLKAIVLYLLLTTPGYAFAGEMVVEGALAEVSEQIGNLVHLKWDENRLAIDREHWKRVAGDKTEAEKEQDELDAMSDGGIPADIAEQRTVDGRLQFWAGSIAIHAFDAAFLRRAQEAEETLPFHIAHKKAAYVDEQGKQVSPDAPNALKFEKFIFDLLPAAKRPLVFEASEEDVFAPLKNAPGAAKDTPEYVRRLLLDQHRRWLRAAGAEVADGVDVEISPLFAPDEQGVVERIKPGTKFDATTYLKEE